jgi:hypothetical protein
MLHQLPTEIALHIASHLPLQSLYRVSLVSRDWNSLVANNEQTVYRNAAILHRFVVLTDLEAQIPDRKQIDWAEFCLCSAPVQLAQFDHLH